MNYGNNSENPLDNQEKSNRERAEELIRKIIDKLQEIRTKMKASLAEQEENMTIMSGLFEQVKILMAEDKIKSAKMPGTDQAWKEWEDRTQRIDRIQGMIEGLLSDQQINEQRTDQLNKEFDALIKQLDAIKKGVD